MVENPNPWRALVRSRKFWLAVFAVIQTIVFNFIPDVPWEVWAAIDALMMVLINSIAKEDAALKANSNFLSGE